MSKVLIIAEAGVNHNGSLDLAMDIVDAAARCGADMVKFQTFTASSLVTPNAPRAPYQKANTGDGGSQFEMLQRLELSKEDHWKLIGRCQEKNIAFLSTPFDPDSLTFLARDLELETIKLGSSELTNAPLLIMAGQMQKAVILSTGMGTLSEVEAALGALAYGYLGSDNAPGEIAFKSAWQKANGAKALNGLVSLLHCTTSYPTPADGVNLLAIDTMRQAFGLPVGYSDHTDGIAAAAAAVSHGATIIEKHITLDRNLPGPDHKASLEPEAFSELVDAIRFVETAMGSGEKSPQKCEIPNLPIARKSLVAKTDIKSGSHFTESNLVVMRPGDGMSPFHYWSLIGTPASQDYAAGALISEDIAE